MKKSTLGFLRIAITTAVLFVLMVLLSHQCSAAPATGFTDKQLDLVTRLVVAEAGNQPYDGQCAVAQTVLDRLNSGNYGETLEDVIYAKGQFCKPKKGDISAWKTAPDAVRAVFIDGYRVYEGQCVVFFNPDTASKKAMKQLRNKYELLGVIDDHEFRGVKAK